MLFQSQIDQYQAYTDRYLAFKVEYRKMVPYGKPQISFGVNFEQAAAAFRKLGEAFRNSRHLIKKSPLQEHENRVIDINNATNNYINNINKIRTEYIRSLCCGRCIEGMDECVFDNN